MDKTLAAVQYLVSEEGQRTGVVLDWETYQALQQANRPADADMLIGLSEPELQSLAAGMLAAPHQEQLEALLQRNRAGELNAEETRALDDVLGLVDSMNMLKTRARYTLEHLTRAA